MSTSTPGLDPALADWLDMFGCRESPELAGLRAASDALPHGGMRSSALQAQLLALLIQLMRAERVLEIGCFTGYGTLAMATALPENGRVITLDINEDTTRLGREYWERAGVAERIELRLGLALDSIETLFAEGAEESFDLVYIDAEKKRYPDYYEAALDLLRPGGLVVLDNMLWKGAVTNLADQSRQAETLRGLTRTIHSDRRVTPVLLPVGDGLMLAKKRGLTVSAGETGNPFALEIAGPD